jgi:hypothetical protein
MQVVLLLFQLPFETVAILAKLHIFAELEKAE